MNRKNVGLAVAGILGGLVLGVAAFVPKVYIVERTVEVKATTPIVYNQVADLTNHEAWSPWKQEDPSIKITLGEQTTGVGASYSWTSDQGPGTLTIRELKPNKRILNDLDFGSMGQAVGYWKFESRGLKTTRVTWGIKGEANTPMARLMVPFMGMMIGPSFDLRLSNLKTAAESALPPERTPAPQPVADAFGPGGEAQPAPDPAPDAPDDGVVDEETTEAP